MTRIIYTITLDNPDGTQVCASTRPLEYPETPSAMLAANVKQTVEDLARSHEAMINAIKQAAQAASQTGVRTHSKGKVAAAGVGG